MIRPESMFDNWEPGNFEDEVEEAGAEAEFTDFIKYAVALTKESIAVIDETGEELEGWQYFFPRILDAIYGIDGCVPRSGRLDRFSYFIYHLAGHVPIEAREVIMASFMPDENGSIMEEAGGRERHFNSLEQWRSFEASQNREPHLIPDASIFQSDIEQASQALRIPL